MNPLSEGHFEGVTKQRALKVLKIVPVAHQMFSKYHPLTFCVCSSMHAGVKCEHLGQSLAPGVIY